ncbi:MAG: GNAT family N-acetyltransferase [Oscillospiraceae bacterium]|nr:GNAT family N-acetyltransferase [Oscillospiraceae bacterium]
MEYTLQKGSWENIDQAVLVEEETLPKSCYLRDNSDYFLNRTQGNLTLVYAGDTPVGIGKLSQLPDGSGWLETLRVRPAWQGKGVGKAIYERWLEEATALGCPAIRMFTGTGNARSKGLAERFGLSLAGTYIGATAKIPSSLLYLPAGFKLVEDFRLAQVLLESGRWEMEDFVVMNNTFFRCGEKTWRYLWEQGMIFADDRQNFVVIGARMLRQRGLHVAMYGGDGRRCLQFAKAYTQRQGLGQVTVSYPPANRRIHSDLEREGFVHDLSCRIVMERVFDR